MMLCVLQFPSMEHVSGLRQLKLSAIYPAFFKVELVVLSGLRANVAKA